MGDPTCAELCACVSESSCKSQYSISVFFPAFNDGPSLPSLLERTFATLRRVASDYEVIVVNDGSVDDTADVLERLREQYAPFLRVVTHPGNLGYGAALRSGFAASTKELVFYTDGDGQYDPSELEQLIPLLGPSTSLVNGYKRERNDPWHRIAIGWLYNRFARWLFRIRLRDIDCDFRLIRRSDLDLDALRSTGGTICIELVRQLELHGTGTEEAPVHHYPRQHGRSQFFRLQSLAVTFFQLCAIFLRLVLIPSWTGTGERKPHNSTLSGRQTAAVVLAIVLLSFLAYAPGFNVPFISDDYLQIQLAREYGAPSQWAALADDALYRCRATSLVLTYWLDRAVGLNVTYYDLTSILFHILNALLVLALGWWRPIGWKFAALAACFFAVAQRHSEAVVWFAAIPELLVFFFVACTFLLWTRWLAAGRAAPFFLAGALVCFALALLSKESAVAAVPLCALAVLIHPGRPIRRVFGLIPFVALGAFYFIATYGARQTHLHFNDGTFSLSAPVLTTLLWSSVNLLWVWGLAALPLFFTPVGRRWRGIIPIALGWMVVTLLPYSFLTYMPRVPSRHTYLASVGTALIVAAGLLVVRRYARIWRATWLVPTVALIIVAHQCGYLWLYKYHQYGERARPTEEVLRKAANGTRDIRANCFPYSPIIAELALSLTYGPKGPTFRVGPESAHDPKAVNFCNADANGVHYQ